MKQVPGIVLAACALCAGCMILAGVLVFVEPELAFATRLIAWLGAAGVAMETFRWGMRQGYVIRGQVLGVQIEHVLRCAAMSAILIFVCVMFAGLCLQVLFECWRGGR